MDCEGYTRLPSSVKSKGVTKVGKYNNDSRQAHTTTHHKDPLVGDNLEGMSVVAIESRKVLFKVRSGEVEIRNTLMCGSEEARSDYRG
jgi:hypothetical protein